MPSEKRADLNAKPCHWCGGRFGVHDERCNVPKMIEQLSNKAPKKLSNESR